MCIAIPYKVLEVNRKGRAEIEMDGHRQEISLLMVPEVKAGDYVLVYLGSAINKVEEDEANEIIRLHQEMAAMELV
jgi:hydrogenase expression/formation protein HypC